MHAADGRDLYEAPVLWVAAAARRPGTRRLRHRTRSREETDAADGAGSDLPEEAFEPAKQGASSLSVSSGRPGDRPARPGLVQRYHLHSAETRLWVSGSGNGLVQPVCAGVGVVVVAGERLLRERGPGRPGGLSTGDLQHGSGSSVYVGGLHPGAEGGAGAHQHGRQGKGLRQHYDRTAVADGEIRRGVPEGLRARV